MSWVAILMGSQSDWSAMESATEVLGDLGIEFEVRVSSAHRTPLKRPHTLTMRFKGMWRVYLWRRISRAPCRCSRCAHDAACDGVPMDAGPLSGIDALLSTVQMPPGIPVATVAVGRTGAKNAGYLAGQILALGNEELAERLSQDRAQNREKVGNKIVRFRRPWTASE
ncbi:MAG: N5-carboxyaminoimidazole ribonucleotide mutase [Gammaproteobacteria bacterium]|nr:MAG: N5-carboxyaminoimidazole ribonucleotide mutase [Gammaproteobacteria bacterium]